MDELIIEDSDENACSICLENTINENLCITNCNHKFCESCITNWFDLGKNSCPNCREKIIRFNLNDKETRIITIDNNQNINTGNVRINNVPVSEIIRNLTNHNLKLRLICYLLVLGGVGLLDLYMNMRFDYIDLDIQYEICQANITHIQDIIGNLHLNDDNVIKAGIVYDSFSHYRICDIPAYFIRRCFGDQYNFFLR